MQHGGFHAENTSYRCESARDPQYLSLIYESHLPHSRRQRNVTILKTLLGKLHYYIIITGWFLLYYEAKQTRFIATIIRQNTGFLSLFTYSLVKKLRFLNLPWHHLLSSFRSEGGLNAVSKSKQGDFEVFRVLFFSTSEFYI